MLGAQKKKPPSKMMEASGGLLLSVILLQITLVHSLGGTVPLHFKICAVKLSSNSFVRSR